MADAYVYILRCRDGTLYTGWTNDLERRLVRHEAGKASRYTASRRPVRLLHAQSLPDRGAALREEARIKRLSRAEKLGLVAASAEPGLVAASAEPGRRGGGTRGGVAA